MITVNRKHPLTWHPGMTVREVLRRMHYIYPHLVVRVNGQVVLEEAYDSYLVPDEADVQVIHLMAGG